VRAITLDAARPGWQRRRAAEAYLNGADDGAGTRRELFDALADEPISSAREALRVQLLARLPSSLVGVADFKSVLADYRRIPEDNMPGGLYGLRRQLEAEPLPELFDAPITGGYRSLLKAPIAPRSSISSITPLRWPFEGPRSYRRLGSGDGY
jgi:hypothetical protein